MRIVELRMPLPMTVQRYHVCQLFLIAKASMEDTKEAIRLGQTDGVEILTNKPFNDGNWCGQYTHKRFSIASKIPRWITSFVGDKWLVFSEKSWNGYPRTKTTYECEMLSTMTLTIESWHEEGAYTSENALKLPPEKINIRTICQIDIVNDTQPGQDPNEFASFSCEQAGIGALKSDWLSTTNPLMTCYKVITLDLPHFGWLSGKVETFAATMFQDLIRKHHRKAVISMEEWINLSLDEVREMELETAKQLAKLMKSPNAKEEEEEEETEVETENEEYLQRPPTKSTSEHGGAADVITTVGTSDIEEEMQKTVHSDSPSAYKQPSEASSEISSPITLSRSTIAAEDEPTRRMRYKKSVRTGRLCKLSDGLFMNSWTTKNLVLKGQNVYYGEAHLVREKLDLVGASVIWSGPAYGKLHSFYVRPHNSRRLVYFSGNSERETKQWLLWLQVAAVGEDLSTVDMNHEGEKSIGHLSPPVSALSRQATAGFAGTIAQLKSESSFSMHRDDRSSELVYKGMSSEGISRLYRKKDGKLRAFLRELQRANMCRQYSVVEEFDSLTVSVKDKLLWHWFSSASPTDTATDPSVIAVSDKAPAKDNVASKTKRDDRSATEVCQHENLLVMDHRIVSDSLDDLLLVNLLTSPHIIALIICIIYTILGIGRLFEHLSTEAMSGRLALTSLLFWIPQLICSVLLINNIVRPRTTNTSGKFTLWTVFPSMLLSSSRLLVLLIAEIKWRLVMAVTGCLCWIRNLIHGGVKEITPRPKSRRIAKASCFFDAAPAKIFESIMDTSIRNAWSMGVTSDVCGQSVDNHTDHVQHLIHPTATAPYFFSDLLFGYTLSKMNWAWKVKCNRVWQVLDDGSYLIIIYTGNHRSEETEKGGSNNWSETKTSSTSTWNGNETISENSPIVALTQLTETETEKLPIESRNDGRASFTEMSGDSENRKLASAVAEEIVTRLRSNERKTCDSSLSSDVKQDINDSVNAVIGRELNKKKFDEFTMSNAFNNQQNYLTDSADMFEIYLISPQSNLAESDTSLKKLEKCHVLAVYGMSPKKKTVLLTKSKSNQIHFNEPACPAWAIELSVLSLAHSLLRLKGYLLRQRCHTKLSQPILSLNFHQNRNRRNSRQVATNSTTTLAHE